MAVEVFRRGPTTARLEHRAFEAGDAETFYALNSHPEVMRLTGETPFPSLQAARDAIAAYPDFDTVGYGRWACILEGKVIGFSGLKYLPELDVVDLGYRFFPEHWGHGFATESGRACVDFAFERLGLTSVHAFVLPDNLASVRVLKKLGFEPDGSVSDPEYPEALSYVVRGFRGSPRKAR